LFSAQAILLCRNRRQRGSGRRHFIKPTPPHRVVPPPALQPIGLVARPGWRVLPAGIAAVAAPQTGVALQPERSRRVGGPLEAARIPALLLSRADTQPVAPSVVDKGDAEAAARAHIWLVALAESRPCTPDGQPDTRKALRVGHNDCGQVFALEEVVGMRPRTWVD